MKCMTPITIILVSLLVFLPLAAHAGEGELHLPGQLSVIGEEAFANISPSVTYIDIPFGTQSIGPRAFADNPGLQEVTVPRTVMTIAEDAFENCGSLTLNVYEGSHAEEWAKSFVNITISGYPLLYAAIQPAMVLPGTPVHCVCEVNGDLLEPRTFQWFQRSEDYSTLVECTLPGSDSPTLEFTATEELIQSRFFCEMTDSTGTYTSASVQLVGFTGLLAIESAAVSGTTVTLTWPDCGGLPCTLMQAEGDGEFEVAAEDLSVPFCFVSDLERNSVYRFKLRLDNGVTSMESAEITVTTQDYVTGTKYRALLIGEVSFDPVCNRNWGDVTRMNSMLGSVYGPEGGQYSIASRRDLLAYNAKVAIASAFAGADADDVSLFFIATHGDYYSPEDQYAGGLCMVNADGEYDWLEISDLAEALSKVPGKVIVILESCGSGAAIYENGGPKRGGRSYDTSLNSAAIKAFSAADGPAAPQEEIFYFDESGQVISGTSLRKIGDFRREKFYVLTASQYMQMSWGTEAGPYNFFTYDLTNGVGTSGAMPADTDGSGTLTLEELYRYIQRVGDSRAHQSADGEVYYQNVQVYPSGSDYVLFMR